MASPKKIQPPTETGKIIAKTLDSPIFPTEPISGYREDMTRRGIVFVFKALKEKWGGRPLSLNEFIQMADDFLGEESNISRTKISRTKLMGSSAKTGNMALSIDEHLIRILSIFANFEGSLLEEFQDADLETKEEEFLELAKAEVAELREAREQGRKTTGSKRGLERLALPTKPLKNSGFTSMLTQTIRDVVFEQGGKPFFDRGFSKEEITELFSGAIVKSDYWFTLGETLGVDAEELLLLLQDYYQRGQDE